MLQGHDVQSKIPLDPELVQNALSKEKWWARIVFWSAAGFLGFLLVGFAGLCEWANEEFLKVYQYSPYLPFLICPVGFLAIFRLQESFFPGVEGSGIPQVMASLRTRSPTLRDQLMSLRVLVGKIICTFLGLLSGASIGREGPSVHIGAALFNFLGHYARFTKFERRQGLVTAGAAAGIAAAFNAPLAGIVFAIEELKGSFEARTSGLMLSAVITAGLVALSIVGHYSYFGRIDVGIEGMKALAVVAIISVVGGVAGGLFTKMILSIRSQLAQIKTKKRYLAPICLGVIVASLGFFSKGNAFGTGYEQAQSLLDATDDYAMMYPVVKFFSTLASFSAGISGGVFAPSLAIGAGIGNLIHPLFSDFPREAMLIIGMVSFLSGIIRAPVTAFVIVYEMTINHLLLLPLMATSFISAGSSRLVQKKALYTGLADVYLAEQRTGKISTGSYRPFKPKKRDS